MPQMNEKLVKYLNGLLKPAQNSSTHKKFDKYKKYYEGDGAPSVGYSYGTDPSMVSNRNYYNCIRPIIETKATIALDSQVTTSVKPSSLSHTNWEHLKDIESVADIINDIWENIKLSNNVSTLHQQIVRDGLIYGLGIAKASWDSTVQNGIGNVSLTRINPLDFFPEPEATTIQNANYIFVRRSLSKFDLIKQYHGNKRVLDILDQLDPSKSAKFDEGEETNILQGYENADDAGQAYLRKGSVFPSSTKTNYTIIECYLKDDTIFQPIKDGNSDDEESKKKEIFKYQNGRLIVYSGNYILEDRPIDYPFGFPFSTFTPTTTNTLVGYGDVKDLIATQDKLTLAYSKLNELISKYRSMLIVSPDSINPSDISKNFDVIVSKRGQIQPPILISNKLSQDIQLMRSHIDNLKKDALSLARINEVMLSGERPVGANSGQMIRDLIESPMSSIREIQRNFKTFLVDLSNKGISLVQLYYTLPRVIRLSGDQFAHMNEDAENIAITGENEDPKKAAIQIPQKILNDYSLTQYEIEVQTGALAPSPTAVAQTTMQLATQGIFGDIETLEVKEIILRALDYPNYRAIIGKLKEEREKAAEVPMEPEFSDYLKNVSLSLKDILTLISTLSPQIQQEAIYSISDSLGLTMGNPDVPTPLPPDPSLESETIEETVQDPNFEASFAEQYNNLNAAPTPPIPNEPINVNF